MTATGLLEQARRAALKALVPHVHALAASYSRTSGHNGMATAQTLVGTQLRKLADLIDAIATKGTARALADLFKEYRT